MIIKGLYVLFRWCMLMAFQVLVLRHVHVGSWIYFFPYILFIIQLPFEFNRFWVLTLAFITGYGIDLYNHTNGIHAFACITIGFVRTFYIKEVALREGLTQIYRPHITEMGSAWFVRYALVLIVLHHSLIFFIEQFSINRLGTLSIKVILSTIATLLMCMGLQLVFTKTKISS
jgi:hypothetical protein